MALIEKGTNLPGRSCHIGFSYKDYIVVWGGWKKDTGDCVYYPANELWYYHPLTRQWTLCHLCLNGEPPPTASPVSALIVDNLYMFGGCAKINGNINQVNHVNTLYCLSLRDCTWKQLTPTGPEPLAVDKLVAWSYNKKFYIFGGYGGPATLSHMSLGFQFVHDDDIMVFNDDHWEINKKGWTNQFFQYDPETNEWSTPRYKGDLPSCRAAHSVVTIGSKVYIFGGRHVHWRVNDLHCLDMDTMQWYKISPARPEPEGRSWCTLTAISDSMLMLCGGFSFRSQALNDCWIFHIKTFRWQKLDFHFETPIFWHSACLTADNEVALFGGCKNNMFINRECNMILISLSPKSLFRLCLERVEELNMPSLWSSLPNIIREILVRRNDRHKIKTIG